MSVQRLVISSGQEFNSKERLGHKNAAVQEAIVHIFTQLSKKLLAHKLFFDEKIFFVQNIFLTTTRLCLKLKLTRKMTQH